MTPKQMNIMRAFSRHTYFGLSASEAGDPEIQQLFDDGFVESYSVSGGTIWNLARKGREYAVEVGLLKTADRLAIDAASGTIQSTR